MEAVVVNFKWYAAQLNLVHADFKGKEDEHCDDSRFPNKGEQNMSILFRQYFSVTFAPSMTQWTTYSEFRVRLASRTHLSRVDFTATLGKAGRVILSTKTSRLKTYSKDENASVQNVEEWEWIFCVFSLRSISTAALIISFFPQILYLNFLRVVHSTLAAMIASGWNKSCPYQMLRISLENTYYVVWV